MNSLFGQKDEQPKGPDPMFAGKGFISICGTNIVFYFYLHRHYARWELETSCAFEVGTKLKETKNQCLTS